MTSIKLVSFGNKKEQTAILLQYYAAGVITHTQLGFLSSKPGGPVRSAYSLAKESGASYGITQKYLTEAVKVGVIEKVDRDEDEPTEYFLVDKNPELTKEIMEKCVSATGAELEDEKELKGYFLKLGISVTRGSGTHSEAWKINMSPDDFEKSQISLEQMNRKEIRHYTILEKKVREERVARHNEESVLKMPLAEDHGIIGTPGLITGDMKHLFDEDCVPSRELKKGTSAKKSVDEANAIVLAKALRTMTKFSLFEEEKTLLAYSREIIRRLPDNIRPQIEYFDKTLHDLAENIQDEENNWIVEVVQSAKLALQNRGDTQVMALEKVAPAESKVINLIIMSC